MIKDDNYFKKAYDIYSNKFKSVLKIILFFYVPFYLLFLMADNLTKNYITGSINMLGISIARSEIALYLFLVMLNLIFTTFFMASIYFLVNDYLKKKEINFNEIILKVFKLSPFILVTISIYYFLIFSSFAFIIVTPFIMTIFYFNTFIVCEGEKNPINALKESYISIKGNILMAFFVIILVSLLDSFLTNILFNFINLSNMPKNMFYNMFYEFISMLISAYFYILLSIWYKNKLENSNSYFSNN